MSQWLARRVIAFDHQRGSFEGPSSTLTAIAHALDVGASAIELDVHATKDRRVVVCHDSTVDRTTNHHGAISDMTLEELIRLDNACWWIDGDVVTSGVAPMSTCCAAARPPIVVTASPRSKT
ncbi:MAG: glycerophosphodiester phosphodiesterase family protein [Acidimicrobiales bacterium]